MTHVELISDTKALLGEGPCWNAQEERLYWIDILGRNLHRFDPVRNEHDSVHVEQQPGTLAPREQGGVIVAMEKGIYFYNWMSENLDPVADPEKHLPNNRFNDGKCDPAGRFWAGTMAQDETSGQGTLYCLESDLSLHEKIKGVSISNGIAWSPDHSFMYYIDTPTEQIVRYEFDVTSGAIQNPVPVINFKDEKGFPDGMTIDEEGMLWIAHWGGAAVTCWNPESGERLERIDVPALNVTSCVFGGKDLNELYITTARKGMSEQDLEAYPLSGGLFKVRTDRKGSPTYSFSG
ncbi:SMP-30/gluconolactonase/LRE family protein [Halobacillus fulvus]|nr:SMP-30/gluconolactonase/LRE family protein [Halobacillus fulvus]